MEWSYSGRTAIIYLLVIYSPQPFVYVIVITDSNLKKKIDETNVLDRATVSSVFCFIN